MYKKIFKNFLYICSIAIVLFFCREQACLLYAYATGTENTSKFIPSDTFLYLNCDFAENKWKILHDHKIVSDWEAFPPVKDIVKSIKTETGLNIDDQLIYQSEQIGVAIGLPEISSLLQGKDPSMIGIIKFKHKNTPSSMLKEILSSYEISHGLTLLPFEDYKGTLIYQFEDPKKTLTFYITVFENYLLVCNDNSFLKKSLDVYTKVEKGLEDSQTFNTVYLKSAKDKILWFYINSEGTLPKIRPFVNLSTDAADFVNTFKLYKGLGIGLGFVKNGLELKTYMVANLNEPMAKAMINKSSYFNEMTQFTPPQPYAYFALTGFSDLYKYIKLGDLQINEWESMKEEISQNLGLDLNLFNNILNQTEEIGINCYEAVGQDGNKLLLPNITVFCKIKNKDLAERSLKQLRIIIGNKNIKFGPWLIYRGRKMTLANRVAETQGMNFRPTYLFFGDYLIVGAYPGAVMKVIDLYYNPFISLLTDINFNDIRMRLGNYKLTSIGYLDISQLIKPMAGNQEEDSGMPDLSAFKRIGLNSQTDGKDGMVGTMLIDIDWDKINMQKLLGGY